MKESIYNHIIPYKKGYLLYNALSKQFVELSSLEKDHIVYFFRNVNKYSNHKSFRDVINKFYQKGFLVDDVTNELVIIKDKIAQFINRKKLLLTIFPTYDCNFSCWYCIQSHVKEYMQEEVISYIKDFIYTYSFSHEIEEIEIKWFGGEPLLCFDSHIKDLCMFIKHFAEEKSIRYFNNITTNAYLITPDIIEQMKIFNFKTIQITIDGNKTLHDQIRNEKGKPSFDIILENVLLLIKRIPDVQLCLRFNYTLDNIDCYSEMLDDINKIIPPDLRNKIYLFPREVWQEKRHIPYSIIHDMIDMFKKNGYGILEYDISRQYMTCDADLKHRFVIFHNGLVDKCENIPPEKAAYRLGTNGRLEKIQKSLLVERDLFLFEKPCQSCNLLPICFGPCKLALKECEIKGFKCVKTYNGFSFNEQVIYYYENVVNAYEKI